MPEVKPDIEIARAATIQPVQEIGAKLDIPSDALEPFGRTKAKLTEEFISGLEGNGDGKLILVTAITPTPAGEGKTTTSVGLTDGLNRIGKRAAVCLREPSLGPCFGMKGGAAGGGYAQVIPMEDINLHFTGDFQGLNQIGLQGILEQYRHGAIRLHFAGRDRRAVPAVANHDITETAAQICQISGQAENCHDLGSHGDVEPALTRESVGHAAQRDDDFPERPVVHIGNPPPSYAALINLERVGPIDVIVDQS